MLRYVACLGKPAGGLADWRSMGDRRGNEVARHGSLGAAVAFFAAASLFAQATESPLARLRVDGKKVGWDAVELGMSIVQVERRTGMTLALTPTGRTTCGAYVVDVERGTLRLSLGFPSAKPGAKLESLEVHFEGYQVVARRSDLVAELKRAAPGATYLPPRDQPNLAEAEAPAPTYLLPGEEGYAARLEPRVSLRLARRTCLD